MTRLKFAHRSDAHVGALHMGRILEDGGSTALRGQHQVLLDFLEACQQQGVVGILNSGDETHTPRPTPDVVDVLMDYHERREEIGLREFGVEGNHTDRPGVSVTDLANRYAHVVNQVEPSGTTARFSPGPHADPQNVQICFLPWLPRNRVKSAEELTAAAVDYVRGLASTLDPSEPSILIVHATIAGGETSTGFSMGFVPDELGYKIPLEELEPFTYVAAGHLHRPQILAKNVAYAGSMFPVDFAEDHPHGFNLVTLCDEPDIDGWQGWHAHIEFQQLATPPIVTAEIHEKQGYLTDDLPEAAAVKGALVRARVHVDAGGRRFADDITLALYDNGALMVQTEIVRPVREQVAAAGKLLSPLEALREAVGDKPDVVELGAEQAARLISETSAGGLGTLHLHRIVAVDLMRIRHATVDFNSDSIVSITGPVGSGKSALFCDVPRLALTGASRAGDRPSEDVIRDGAEGGMAELAVRTDDGRKLIFRRTFRRKKGGGVTTSLDVEEYPGGAAAGRPLTDGKVASGDAMIAALTGGLDDRTLKASTFVVQREADAFTSARPEDRKRILADAAGLSHLDTLAQDALDHGRDATKNADRAKDEADHLRPRIIVLETEHVEAEHLATVIPGREVVVADAKELVDAQKAAVDDAVSRATERTTAEAAVTAALKIRTDLHSDHITANTELRTLESRRDVLVTLSEKIAAQGDTEVDIRLAGVQRDEAKARRTERVRDAEARRDATTAIDRLRALRRHKLGIATEKLTSASGRTTLLEKAKCCEPEPECVFLIDARAAAALVPALSQDVAAFEADDPDEQPFHAIIKALGDELPDVDLAPYEDHLRKMTERHLLRNTDVALQERLTADIAKIPEYEKRVAELRRREDEATAAHNDAEQKVQAIAPVTDVGELKAEYVITLSAHNSMAEALQEDRGRLAYLRGRTADLVTERATLAAAEEEAKGFRTLADNYATLNAGWKTARVVILEHSIIPAVEKTANEILALSPTGITLRLDRSEGDDLELRLEGGLAPSYKLASGGQRTWVDVALHIAIALVVAQRVQTRLDFLFVDEPEGLDTENRAHFGRVLRWVHDTHGLTVLAASHHEDLVELVADRVITLVPTAEGTTV